MASTLLEYLNDVHGAIVVLAEIEAIGDHEFPPAAARRDSTGPDDVAPTKPPTDHGD